MEQKVNLSQIKQVIVKYKKLSDKPEYTQENHVLFGGMLNNTTVNIPLPLHSSGMYIEVLDEEERKKLAEITKREPNYFLVNNPDGYFKVQGYKMRTVSLSKENKYLNLDKLDDYIQYKILFNSPTLVSPNPEGINKYDTIRWYLSEEGKETNKSMAKIDLLDIILRHYRAIKEDRYVLKYILFSLGHRTAKDITLEVLQGMISERIDNSPKDIKTYLIDKYLILKARIYEASEYGILSITQNLVKSNSQLGDLTFSNKASTFDNVAKFLSEKTNIETKNKLEGLIEKAKKA